MFVSYAQNFEDVLLWRALKHVGRGFYVDCGAQDPVVDSVSNAFYACGWRGLHVEPVNEFAEKLRNARPDDTVIEAALRNYDGATDLHVIDGTGLSTVAAALADDRRAQGYEVRTIKVPCITLSQVFSRVGERDIHWIKFDVEGLEGEVLGAWPPRSPRPWIVVVETVHGCQDSQSGWQRKLEALGYIQAHYDGLNRYYVSNQHQELMATLSVGPNVFDNFTLSGTATAPFCRQLLSQLAAERSRNLDVPETKGLLAAISHDIKTAVAQQHSGISALTEKIAAAARLQQELAALNERLHEATTEAMRLKLDLDHAERARLAADYRSNAVAARAADLQIEVSRLRLEQKRSTEQLERSRGETDRAHQAVNSLVTSRSWRLTGPLRALARCVRKIHAISLSGPLVALVLLIRTIPGMRPLFRPVLAASPRLRIWLFERVQSQHARSSASSEHAFNGSVDLRINRSTSLVLTRLRAAPPDERAP